MDVQTSEYVEICRCRQVYLRIPYARVGGGGWRDGQASYIVDGMVKISKLVPKLSRRDDDVPHSVLVHGLVDVEGSFWLKLGLSWTGGCCWKGETFSMLRADALSGSLERGA